MRMGTVSGTHSHYYHSPIRVVSDYSHYSRRFFRKKAGISKMSEKPPLLC
jgi:hypothetical protein